MKLLWQDVGCEPTTSAEELHEGQHTGGWKRRK